ncbi:MAG TPA: squalene/phytoene synthase family protein [Steroidobacteraceae bacterium]|nr:squalene/phytoene synthase family protein [Steroidobacteraceae bacterium]
MAAAAEPPARTLARLYCPAPQRSTLAALLGIEAEIRAPLHGGAAHEVAHARLQWWREECLRLAAGNPQHPLTRALGEQFPGARRAELCTVGGFVELATWDLAAATFESRRELEAYSARWSAALVGPLAHLALPADGHPRAQALGRRLHELELLNALGPHARAGWLRLPLAELAQAEVPPEQLASQPWGPQLAALVRTRHGEARAGLALAVAALAPQEQAALAGLLVWAVLASAHSHRVLAALPYARGPGEHHAVLDGWRAWRAARRAARGRLRLAPR